MKVWGPMYSLFAWGKCLVPAALGVSGYPYGFYGTYGGLPNAPYSYYCPGIFQRRRTWHGIITVFEKYYWPANPHYSVNTGNRIRFAEGVYAWQQLTAAEKKFYNQLKFPRRMSGYNRFLHYYIKQNMSVPIYWGNLSKSASDSTLLGTLLDQAVKQDSSPTFAGLTVGTGLSLGDSGQVEIGNNGFGIFTIGSSTNSSGIAAFDISGLTTYQTFTLPDASGRLVLRSELDYYVPYTDATADVDLNGYNITAGKFITLGGNSSQFVKGDGTLDSHTYLTSESDPVAMSYLDQSVKTTSSPTFAGLTLSGLSAGSVLFVGTGGVISQNNSYFFWDNTNKRLGIGTATPSVDLEVRNGNNQILFDVSGGWPPALNVKSSSGVWVALSGWSTTPYIGTVSNHSLYYVTNNTYRWGVSSAGGFSFGGSYYNINPGTNNMIIQGSVGIGTNSSNYKLHVVGTLGFNPGSSVTPANNGDIVIELTSNTQLTFKAKGSDGVVRSASLTLA